MKLYFDIGNTDIKLNFNFEGQEFYVSYPTHEENSVDSLYQKLPKEVTSSHIESAAIVSVVPKGQHLIEGLIKKYWQIKSMVLGYPLKTGVKINVDNPKEVGSDLVALASFATTQGDDVTIVNLGTATTFINVKNRN